MLYVVVFACSVFLGGLLLLALLAWRAFGQVRSLGRTVAGASGRIADATEEIARIVPENRSVRSREG